MKKKSVLASALKNPYQSIPNMDILQPSFEKSTVIIVSTSQYSQITMYSLSLHHMSKHMSGKDAELRSC